MILHKKQGGKVNQDFIANQSQQEKKPKIIKRYGNRKLYDTEQSSYVVLNDIAKMIRNNEEVRVIDNETKDDITNSTLTQIIFSAEKKSPYSTPLNILKDIIMKGDGSLSNFFVEKGICPRSSSTGEALARPLTEAVKSAVSNLGKEAQQPSAGVRKTPSLEERIVSAASSSSHDIEENDLPELPNSNKNL